MKWNQTAWTILNDLPINFHCGGAVNYHGDIHLLGGNGIEKSHVVVTNKAYTQEVV